MIYNNNYNKCIINYNNKYNKKIIVINNNIIYK